MYDSVLLPTDGRPGTEGAVTRALDLARTCDATLHALSVVEPVGDRNEFQGADLADARQALEERGHAATIEIQERAAGLDLDLVREVRDGDPHRAILEYVAENDLDTVVMGVRGRFGRHGGQFGSTTERVVTHSAVPVFAIPAEGNESIPERERGAYDRVLIPTDGSDGAERAAEHALSVAEWYGADVRVVYVVDANTYGMQDAPRSIVGLLKDGGRTAVERITAQATERNLDVSSAILRGIPEDALLRYADGAEVDLIAMGTRGRADVDDHLLGSTTARVVSRSGFPVMTVS